MAIQTQQYSKVSSEDSVTGEEDVGYFTDNWNYQRLRLSLKNRNVLLFILSLFFFIFSLLNLFISSHGRVTDRRCAEHMAAVCTSFQTNPHATVLDDLTDVLLAPVMEAVEYEWKTFENDFFHDSVYRGHPTAELEKAWDDLWNYGAFNVPKDMLPKLNKSTTGWREVPEEKGGGVAGLLEGFHQIHCLNLIRQYTYRDEWDYSALPSFDGTPQLVRHHVDHCIETLRINLMCTADVTPYLIEINPNRRLGEDPNFNTLHKCRKWDKLVEWAKEHEIFRTVDPASGHHGHN